MPRRVSSSIIASLGLAAAAQAGRGPPVVVVAEHIVRPGAGSAGPPRIDRRARGRSGVPLGPKQAEVERHVHLVELLAVERAHWTGSKTCVSPIMKRRLSLGIEGVDDQADLLVRRVEIGVHVGP